MGRWSSQERISAQSTHERGSLQSLRAPRHFVFLNARNFPKDTKRSETKNITPARAPSLFQISDLTKTFQISRRRSRLRYLADEYSSISKAGPAINSPNSVWGRKSRTPAQFTTFDTAIYPECNLQSGAATLRGRAPLVRRPQFNKCALTGDSPPKETGVLGRFPEKTPLYFSLDKLTQRMTQGYLTDPATRHICVCKRTPPSRGLTHILRPVFELPAPRRALH